VAIVDPVSKPPAKRVRTGIDTYYSDYRAALDNQKIDAIVVVAPTVYHRDIVVAAAKLVSIFCVKNRWRWLWPNVMR